MASLTSCLAPLQRRVVCSAINPACPRSLQPGFTPLWHIRQASGASARHNAKKEQEKTKKKKKSRTTFVQYIRAFEVGRVPTSSKYEMHVRLRTLVNGPAIRNRLRLPHPVNTSLRICVICPPDSPIAASAIKAGASLVGDDAIIDAVKDSRIEFDRCLCHVDSVQKINKAGLGKVLGPKGLMPSVKTGTVVKDVAASVRELVGGSEYRERQGVIRMAVGQLGFTPEEMQRNIKVFMDGLKKDISQMSDRISKEIHEVVLSSTNAPGFSLNGEFRSPTSLPTRDLSVL